MTIFPLKDLYHHIQVQPMLVKTTAVIACLLPHLIGCAGNPYIDGFTGQTTGPLPDDAPVAVIGANRADPLQMRDFDHAYADAKAGQQLLRDADASEAARHIGASLVLYNFIYLDSTVERDTQSYQRFSKSGDTYYRERRSFDTTRHWYEYRAYFFTNKPGDTDSGPADPVSP